MENVFEKRFGVSTDRIGAVLGQLLLPDSREGELYFEYTVGESMALEDGIVRSASRNVRQGMGARCVAGLETGYAFTESLDPEALLSAARAARGIARDARGARTVSVAAGFRDGGALYDALPVEAFGTHEERARLLAEVDAAARAYDPRVAQVMASLAVSAKWILVADAEGKLTADMQPMVRFMVTCVARDGAARETGSEGLGGREGFALLTRNGAHRAKAREAARLAVEGLSAVESPAGMMTVVLGAGSPGILLHEAIGHGLEADFNRAGTSAFANRIGENVASPLCTVVDDGTLPRMRGAIHADDEGTPSSRTVLIEKGKLVGYLQDRQNARLMGMRPTGNARRESFAHVPMPRMTCTYMESGTDTPEDVVRSVDRGIYFAKFSSGQVDITNGNFVFSSSEARLIEGGKLTRPLKNATLTGNGPEVLKRVSRVANDLAHDAGTATCGKEGQWVPVNCGLPTIRVDGMTVGGTAQTPAGAGGRGA